MPLPISPPRGPASSGLLAADTAKFVTAKKAGAQTVATLAATENFYNDTDLALTIATVRATVGTAPTGATFIVDVLVNGTSIYTGVTANRPTIAISAFTAVGGTPATLTVPVGGVVTFTVGTAPTGATFIVDVLVNGTSIYTGVTANRPTIAISAFTAVGGTPATLTVPVGGVVTFTVAQIGSTVAGSDLVIQLTLNGGQ